MIRFVKYGKNIINYVLLNVIIYFTFIFIEA
jgi:hypothetical protein